MHVRNALLGAEGILTAVNNSSTCDTAQKEKLLGGVGHKCNMYLQRIQDMYSVQLCQCWLALLDRLLVLAFLFALFRQIVARTVLETLRVVVDDANDVAVVLQVMNKLADDVGECYCRHTNRVESHFFIASISEPSVRAELMEQVPHIAMFCQEFKLQLSSVVPDHLLPMVVKFLTDTNNQVRKTSQAALLVLLEQGLVEKSDVQDQVCPVIIRLTEPDSLDDYRTEAVAVSSVPDETSSYYCFCVLMPSTVGHGWSSMKDMGSEMLVHWYISLLCLPPSGCSELRKSPCVTNEDSHLRSCPGIKTGLS